MQKDHLTWNWTTTFYASTFKSQELPDPVPFGNYAWKLELASSVTRVEAMAKRSSDLAGPRLTKLSEKRSKLVEPFGNGRTSHGNKIFRTSLSITSKKFIDLRDEQERDTLSPNVKDFL